MATQAFKVQRGTTTIADSASSATITAGVAYTAPSALTSAFIRITNTTHSGMGATSGGGAQLPSNIGAYISNPENLTTSITFTRAGTSGIVRIDWEIIEYVGGAGDANEMIVRDEGVISFSSGTSSTGTTVTTIDDNSDVVVFITGTGTNDSSNFDLSFGGTASLVANSSNWDPTITAGFEDTSSTRNYSYAVVEFTGSNWTVNRVAFTDDGSTWAGSGDNTSWNYTHGITLADTTKTFLHTQHMTSITASQASLALDAIGVASTTQFKIYQRSASGIGTRVVWIVQNAGDMSVQHIDFEDDTTSGSEERSFTLTVTEVSDLEQSSPFVSSSADSGNAPIGRVLYRLTDTTTLTFTESENSQERKFLGQIVQWPQDPSLGTNSTTSGGFRTKRRQGRLKARVYRATR